MIGRGRSTGAALCAVLLAVAAGTARAQDAGRVDRTGQVITALHRSGAIPRCWNQYLAATPEASSVHFRIRVEVSATGAVTSVTLLDPTPPTLASCVRSEVRQALVPAGAAVTVESTYGFAAGMPAPVPVPESPQRDE